MGQRRIIASHTAGPSAVYTLGTAWTTTPSTSAKFVIELPNLLLMRSSAQTATYVYNYGDATVNNGTNSITSASWSSTYFNASATSNTAGNVWMPSYGIQPDAARNSRHSFCYFFRGGGANLDMLDIAGSISGTWTGAITYDGSPGAVPTTGSCGEYAPFGNEGRMVYLNLYTNNVVSQIFRFDVKNRVLSPYTPTDWVQLGTAAVGNRIACYCAIDGADIYDVVFLQAHASSISQELICLV